MIFEWLVAHWWMFGCLLVALAVAFLAHLGSNIPGG